MSRILVVEDEAAIAELISINLRHAGFEVTVAGDAEQAHAAVEVGGLKLDPATRRVTRDELEVKVGPTEFRLLHFFMTHPERVHSRDRKSVV